MRVQTRVSPGKFVTATKKLTDYDAKCEEVRCDDFPVFSQMNRGETFLHPVHPVTRLMFWRAFSSSPSSGRAFGATIFSTRVLTFSTPDIRYFVFIAQIGLLRIELALPRPTGVSLSLVHRGAVAIEYVAFLFGPVRSGLGTVRYYLSFPFLFRAFLL